jgi:hypothetical protein
MSKDDTNTKIATKILKVVTAGTLATANAINSTGVNNMAASGPAAAAQKTTGTQGMPTNSSVAGIGWKPNNKRDFNKSMKADNNTYTLVMSGTPAKEGRPATAETTVGTPTADNWQHQ